MTSGLQPQNKATTRRFLNDGLGACFDLCGADPSEAQYCAPIFTCNGAEQ